MVEYRLGTGVVPDSNPCKGENFSVKIVMDCSNLNTNMYKIYNGDDYNEDWQDMNRQQNFNARCEVFRITNCSNINIGRNIMCNRLTTLNGHIKLDWLNLSLTAFKLKAKLTFLSN